LTAMRKIYETIDKLSEKGRTGVVATIIRQTGSAPRGTGTKCLILDDGSLVGTIGGGILEARTLEAAREIFDTGLPVRLYFSLQGSDVAGTDMLCGGQVEVFLEPVSARNPTHIKIFRMAGKSLSQGGGGLLITLIDREKWQRAGVPKMFLGKDGEKVGSLQGAQGIEDALFEKSGKLMRSRNLSLFSMRDDQGNLSEVLVEPVVADSFLYVFGAGHVSKQIVPLANRVGFHVAVIDDREEFADPGLFPEADEIHCTPFEGVMESLVIDKSAFVVIVTRGHVHDKTVLAQSLKTGAKYIGMIGSRRKRDIIYQKLLEEGFTQKDIGRVHSPIGLDIGAETPEEIAVSIVAELIQVRAET
jgi:xanthine dehydrogenase accessory factor